MLSESDSEEVQKVVLNDKEKAFRYQVRSFRLKNKQITTQAKEALKHAHDLVVH